MERTATCVREKMSPGGPTVRRGGNIRRLKVKKRLGDRGERGLSRDQAVHNRNSLTTRRSQTYFERREKRKRTEKPKKGSRAKKWTPRNRHQRRQEGWNIYEEVEEEKKSEPVRAKRSKPQFTPFSHSKSGSQLHGGTEGGVGVKHRHRSKAAACKKRLLRPEVKE